MEAALPIAQQDSEKRKQFVDCLPQKVRKYLATFEQGNGFVVERRKAE
jgi:hypothetical protein